MKKNTFNLTLLTGIFCLGLITSNLFGGKLISVLGLTVAGAIVTAGTELTPGSDGTLVAAEAGDFVCAIAMNDCNANAMGTVKRVDYYKKEAK